MMRFKMIRVDSGEPVPSYLILATDPGAAEVFKVLGDAFTGGLETEKQRPEYQNFMKAKHTFDEYWQRHH